MPAKKKISAERSALPIVQKIVGGSDGLSEILESSDVLVVLNVRALLEAARRLELSLERVIERENR